MTYIVDVITAFAQRVLNGLARFLCGATVDRINGRLALGNVNVNIINDRLRATIYNRIDYVLLVFADVSSSAEAGSSHKVIDYIY